MIGNNPILAAVTVTASWATLLASTGSTGSFVITPHPNNAADVQFRVDGGSGIAWPAGVAIDLRSVDLSRIEIQGTLNDIVLIAGGNW